MGRMIPKSDAFRRSIRRQIELHQARSPTDRFLALCDLLDFLRATAPSDEAARQRRLRVLAARQRERERFRETLRRLIATGRTDASTGV